MDFSIGGIFKKVNIRQQWNAWCLGFAANVIVTACAFLTVMTLNWFEWNVPLVMAWGTFVFVEPLLLGNVIAKYFWIDLEE